MLPRERPFSILENEWLISDQSDTGPYLSSSTPATWTWASDFTSWSPITLSRKQQCNTFLDYFEDKIRKINIGGLVSRLVVMCLMKRCQPYVVSTNAVSWPVWCWMLMHVLLSHHVKCVCYCELGPKFESYCPNPSSLQPFSLRSLGSLSTLFFCLFLLQ